MSTMTIKIERTAHILNFGGKKIEVKELSVEHCFPRKQCLLGEVKNYNYFTPLKNKHYKLIQKSYPTYKFVRIRIEDTQLFS
jgi:hypothetical protein